jgi:hypothetical protein
MRLAASLALALLTIAASSGARVKAQSPAEPVVLRADDRTHTPIGLIYSPDVLAALLAANGGETPDAKLATAARERTPVVVMWSVPLPPDLVPPSPFRIVITARGVPAGGPDQIEARWVQRDAAALARLDPRVQERDVAAVAAFGPADVVPGRFVCLFAEYPPDFEKQRAKSIDRCARL